MEHISFDYFAVFVIDLNIILCQDHSLIIFDQVYFSDVFQKSRNIDAMKLNPFPIPATSGASLRTATILSGSAAAIAATA